MTGHPSPLHRATDAFTVLLGYVDALLAATTPEQVERALQALRRVHPQTARDFTAAMDAAREGA